MEGDCIFVALRAVGISTTQVHGCSSVFSCLGVLDEPPDITTFE